MTISVSATLPAADRAREILYDIIKDERIYEESFLDELLYSYYPEGFHLIPMNERWASDKDFYKELVIKCCIEAILIAPCDDCYDCCRKGWIKSGIKYKKEYDAL